MLLSHHDQLGWRVDIYNADVWPDTVSEQVLTRSEAGLRPDVVEWLDKMRGEIRVYEPHSVCFESYAEAAYFLMRFY